MKWYVVIKAFFILHSSIGPFDSYDECMTNKTSMMAEGQARYAAGERIEFMGKSVSPKNVEMTCKQK